MSCFVLGCSGRLFERRERGQADPFERYAGLEEYAIVKSESSRALIRLDEDACVLFSSQDNGLPLIMEHPAYVYFRRTDQHADRLLTGVSGPLGLYPREWRLLHRDDQRVSIQRNVYLDGGLGNDFAMSIERDIGLLDVTALQTFVSGGLPPGLRVSGHESRTLFLNPGPLPWPRGSGLPYIRVEGDLLRSAETLFMLHMKADIGDVLARQFNGQSASVSSVFVGVYRESDDTRFVLPSDLVLSRVALLDRKRGVLTLIAYTAPAGAAAVRDAGQERVDPEIQIFAVEGTERWYRVVTTGVTLPLATGGSIRHNRQTFHVRGDAEALLRVAAAFCRLAIDDVLASLAVLDGESEP